MQSLKALPMLVLCSLRGLLLHPSTCLGWTFSEIYLRKTLLQQHVCWHTSVRTRFGSSLQKPGVKTTSPRPAKSMKIALFSSPSLTWKVARPEHRASAYTRESSAQKSGKRKPKPDPNTLLGCKVKPEPGFKGNPRPGCLWASGQSTTRFTHITHFNDHRMNLWNKCEISIFGIARIYTKDMHINTFQSPAHSKYSIFIF